MRVIPWEWRLVIGALARTGRRRAGGKLRRLLDVSVPEGEGGRLRVLARSRAGLFAFFIRVLLFCRLVAGAEGASDRVRPEAAFLYGEGQVRLREMRAVTMGGGLLETLERFYCGGRNPLKLVAPARRAS